MVFKNDRPAETKLVGQGVQKAPTGPIGSCRLGRFKRSVWQNQRLLVKLFKGVAVVELNRVRLRVRSGSSGLIKGLSQRSKRSNWPSLTVSVKVVKTVRLD